jgi:hypothetical protein
MFPAPMDQIVTGDPFHVALQHHEGFDAFAHLLIRYTDRARGEYGRVFLQSCLYLGR